MAGNQDWSLLEQEENHRRFGTDDNEWIFTRDGGTGFWTVAPSKGAIPKVLLQDFTTLSYAKAAVDHYLRTRPAPKVTKKKDAEVEATE